MQDVWVSIIGGICVAVPSILATVSSNKKTTSLMLYRIEQLEKKQEKHNNLMERTFKLEEDVKLIKEEVFK